MALSGNIAAFTMKLNAGHMTGKEEEEVQERKKNEDDLGPKKQLDI